MPVSSGGPSELDKSRDRADPRLLDQAEHGAEGVLRADLAQLDIDALSGRGEQGSTEELSGHGGPRMRLPLTS